MLLGKYLYKIKVKNLIKGFYKNDGNTLFRQIQIETVNRCNGNCSFCPVNVNEPQRVYAKMDARLFKDIINQLVEMNYVGEVSFSSNNEPMLDSRILEFIKYARQQLPKAYFTMWSNGTLLNQENSAELVKYLDRLYIDLYSKDYSIPQNIEDIIDNVFTSVGYTMVKGLVIKNYASKVVIFLRDVNQVLSSRGGKAPNKKIARTINMSCEYPYTQMIVRPTGEVSLCCSDALGLYTMGDLRVQSILDVWNSDKFEKVRKDLLKNKRKGLFLCKDCDFPL